MIIITTIRAPSAASIIKEVLSYNYGYSDKCIPETPHPPVLKEDIMHI